MVTVILSMPAGTMDISGDFMGISSRFSMGSTEKPLVIDFMVIPSGEHTKSNGKSPCLMGKSTISTGPCSIAMLMFTRGYQMGCNMMP